MKCAACGVDWRKHRGATGMCAEIQALKAELGAATAALDALKTENARLHGELEILRVSLGLAP